MQIILMQILISQDCEYCVLPNLKNYEESDKPITVGDDIFRYIKSNSIWSKEEWLCQSLTNLEIVRNNCWIAVMSMPQNNIDA